MNDDHEDGPPLELPRSVAHEEEPTNPEASPRALRPSTTPPPQGSEYLDVVYKQLLEVHREQMSRFADLHDEDGPLRRLNDQIELVLFEVRGVRRDFASVHDRLLKLEERADHHDRRLRKLEARGEKPSANLPPISLPPADDE